jgi:hypothetical protein
VAGAHTTYPPDYLKTCLKWLQRTGADIVGGPMLTQPGRDGFAPKVIAAILSSRFGVGNAEFRTGLKEGWVDTVPYGAYRREVFACCGGYDETLVRAQDCELHARMRHSGKRIFQTPELLTYYHPGTEFHALWRKAFLDGLWQCYAAIKSRHSFAPRRFAPVVMLLLLGCLVVIALFNGLAWIAIAVFILLYLLAGFYFGSSQTGSSGLLTRLSLPFFAFPFHICYGAGTLAGLWHILREPGRSSASRAMRPLQCGSSRKSNEKTF